MKVCSWRIKQKIRKNRKYVQDNFGAEKNMLSMSLLGSSFLGDRILTQNCWARKGMHWFMDLKCPWNNHLWKWQKAVDQRASDIPPPLPVLKYALLLVGFTVGRPSIGISSQQCQRHILTVSQITQWKHPFC